MGTWKQYSQTKYNSEEVHKAVSLLRRTNDDYQVEARRVKDSEKDEYEIYYLKKDTTKGSVNWSPESGYF